MSMSNVEFALACRTAKNLAELVVLSGQKESTVVQRRSKLRGEGWPIPEFTKGRVLGSGGGKKGPSLEDLERLAASSGSTVDALQAESVAIVSRVHEHAERVKAGKLAKVGVGTVANTETANTEAPTNVG